MDIDNSRRDQNDKVAFKTDAASITARARPGSLSDRRTAPGPTTLTTAWCSTWAKTRPRSRPSPCRAWMAPAHRDHHHHRGERRLGADQRAAMPWVTEDPERLERGPAERQRPAEDQRRGRGRRGGVQDRRGQHHRQPRRAGQPEHHGGRHLDLPRRQQPGAVPGQGRDQGRDLHRAGVDGTRTP